MIPKFPRDLDRREYLVLVGFFFGPFQQLFYYDSRKWHLVLTDLISEAYQCSIYALRAKHILLNQPFSCLTHNTLSQPVSFITHICQPESRGKCWIISTFLWACGTDQHSVALGTLFSFRLF